MESIPSIYSASAPMEPLRKAILSDDLPEIKNLLKSKEIRSTFLEWTHSNSKFLKGNLRFRKIVDIAKKKEHHIEKPLSSQIVTKPFKSLESKIQHVYWKTKKPSPLDKWLDDEKITREFRDFIISQKGFKSLTAYYDLGLINDAQLKEILFIENGQEGGVELPIIHIYSKQMLPLLISLSKKSPEFLKEILIQPAQKTNVRPLELDGFQDNLPLFEILAEEQPKLIKEIFDSYNKYTSPVLYNEDNFQEALPFLKIVGEKDLEILKDILCIKDQYGTTLFWHHYRHVEEASELLESFIDTRPDLLEEILTVKDNGGSTFLHLVDTFKNALPLLQKLADKEPKIFENVLSIKNDEGKTAFHHKSNLDDAILGLDVLAENHPDLVYNLLTIQDNEGKRPLDIFKDILTTENENGETLIHYPSPIKDTIEINKILAEREPLFLKKLLDTQNKDGNTPLHLEKTFAEIIPLLEILSDKSPDILMDLFSLQNKDGHISLNSKKILEKTLPFLESLAEKNPPLFIKILGIQNHEGKTFLHFPGQFQPAVPLLKKISEKQPDLFKDLLGIKGSDGASLLLPLYLDVIEDTHPLFPYIQDRLKQEKTTSIIKEMAQFVSPEYEEKLTQQLKTLIGNKPFETLPLILSNPLLSKMLIINQRLYLDDGIKNGYVNLQKISYESQIDLLPLFSPNDIRSLAMQLTRDEWDLSKSINEQKFSIAIDDDDLSQDDKIYATAEELFNIIENHYGQAEFGADNLYQNTRIRKAAPLLSQIPFSCLAAAMLNPELNPFIMNYFEAFSLAHQQIIFALLPDEHALTLIGKTRNISDQTALFSFATTGQKSFILSQVEIGENFLRLLKSATKQCEKWEENLRLLTNQGIEIIPKVDYAQLDQSFNSFRLREGRKLNDQARQILNLKKILLENSDSNELKNFVEKQFSSIFNEFDAVSNRIKKCQNDFAKIEKPKALSEATEADEEYDALNLPLENPVLGSDGMIYNQTSFDNLRGKSAFSRQPIEIVEKKNLSKYPHLVEKYKEFEKLKKKISKS